MSRSRFTCILLTFAAGGAFLLPAFAQTTPSTPPASRPFVMSELPDRRPPYVGLRTNNTYQPLPRHNADGTVSQPGPVRIQPIPDAIRAGYKLDRYYTRCLLYGPIVIMGSDRVSDYAFLEAAYTLDHQLHDSPQYILDALKKDKVRLAILACVEYTMDLPESYNNPKSTATLAAAAFQDRRSRGLGGVYWVSCAEENLLNLPGDPYGGNGQQGSGENITIHEFSHTLANAIRYSQTTDEGRRQLDKEDNEGPMTPTMQGDGKWWMELHAAYVAAMAPGGRLQAWNESRGTKVYASTDEQEYWAEGAQAWFNNANPNNSGGISTRDDVKQKDPALAMLLAHTYGDAPWRYIKTTSKNPDGTPMRPADELEHLKGIDAVREKFPAFSFANSPRVQADPGSNRGRGGGRGGAGRGRGNAAQPATAPGSP